jgi:penicillin-binding protein 2
MIRVKIVKGIILFVFIFLLINLFNLQLMRAGMFRDLSSKNCIRLLPQEGSRGKILDRGGNLIVGNELCYDLLVLPETELRIEEVLRKLSSILYMNLDELRKKFKENYVARAIPVTLVRNIDSKRAIVLEELKQDIGSIIIQPRPQRLYPYGELSCHVLGYLGEIDRWRLTKLADYGYQTKDLVGFGGVEEKYDYYLKAQEGGLSFEVDYRSRFVRILGFRPAYNGKDIQLTLDLNIQKIVEDTLAQRAGSIIIMHPYTGEIIALASHPGFSPISFLKRSKFSLGELLSSPDAPLINRAISATYPPGSVFKLVVATAGLETHKINPATTFFCDGNMQLGNREFSCWDTHRQENIFGAMAHSCNIFFYKTGLLLGAQLIHAYALKFGFSKLSGIDLPYEADGFVPSPFLAKIYKMKNWFAGDTANFAIGQGDLLVTPLQIVRMMAVFANKGYLVGPYIVRRVGDKDISHDQERIIDLHLKSNTIECIRQGLREAVSGPLGTANVLATLPIWVAGKTGTAQISPGIAHGWFSGFFPFKNPKFVICVFLEHGGSGHAATVVAKEIIEKMLQEKLID